MRVYLYIHVSKVFYGQMILTCIYNNIYIFIYLIINVMLKIIIILLMLFALAVEIIADIKYYTSGSDYRLASNYFLLVIIILWLILVLKEFDY